jgi:hypothetical protein
MMIVRLSGWFLYTLYHFLRLIGVESDLARINYE